ncbi:hypothetical protein AHAS_Ahas19G0276100 [Arachis hypogaea]
MEASEARQTRKADSVTASTPSCRRSSSPSLEMNQWFAISAALLKLDLVRDKAMIIVAWNGSGNPSVIFNSDVFKKVLSVFITAAILKLGQGRG